MNAQDAIQQAASYEHVDQGKVAYARGMVETWLEGATKIGTPKEQETAKRILAEFGVVEKAYKTFARQNLDLKQKLIQAGFKAQSEPSEVEASLHWPELGVAMIDVQAVESNGQITAGAAYVLIEPLLETPPYSTTISLSQLKAVVQLLETKAEELPTMRADVLNHLNGR